MEKRKERESCAASKEAIYWSVFYFSNCRKQKAAASECDGFITINSKTT